MRPRYIGIERSLLLYLLDLHMKEIKFEPPPPPPNKVWGTKEWPWQVSTLEQSNTNVSRVLLLYIMLKYDKTIKEIYIIYMHTVDHLIFPYTCSSVNMDIEWYAQETSFEVNHKIIVLYDARLLSTFSNIIFCVHLLPLLYGQHLNYDIELYVGFF